MAHTEVLKPEQMTIAEEIEDTNSSQEGNELPKLDSITSGPSAFLIDPQQSSTVSERKSMTAAKMDFSKSKFKNPKRSLEKELHIFSHQKKKNQNQA